MEKLMIFCGIGLQGKNKGGCHMKGWKILTLYLGVIVLFIALALGAWAVSRSINYSLSYKSMVQDTVREMVKPEALK